MKFLEILIYNREFEKNLVKSWNSYEKIMGKFYKFLRGYGMKMKNARN